MDIKFFIAFIFISCLLGCKLKKNTKKIAELAPVETPLNISQLYKNYCSSCHGMQLQQFKVLKTYKKPKNDISSTIKNGKIDKGMPAFGTVFNNEQVESLTNYIKTFNYDDIKVNVSKSIESLPFETVIDGLEIPWSFEFLPDGDMLIAEKKGVLSLFSKTKVLRPILGLPEVNAKGQGGLLDVKLHPDFATNGWIYIAYSYRDLVNKKHSNTAVIRAKLKNYKLYNIEPIYKGFPATSTSHHYGTRLVFDANGYLFFANGDRGNRDEFPQKLDNTNGKIHRLHDDGRVPADNPFVNSPSAVKSIYSYGHRNPQGLILHPDTGELWEHEHGPKGGDEINVIKKGANYGWPIISFGINYNGTTFTDKTHKKGMEQPLFYYLPSIAPCGMAFIPSTSKIYPKWQGNVFVGSLKFKYLERITLKGKQVINQEKLLADVNSRVRDVRLGPDGYLYVALENPGRIIKIRPH